MENGGAVLDHSCVDTRTIGDSFLVPHNFTSVAYGRQSTEKSELLVGPLRVLSGKILHRPIQKNYAESRNYAEFAAWCTVHPKLAKIVSAIQKGLDRPKSANYPFLLFTNPEESDDAWYPLHGKSERRFRRHFPARDIAKEDLLQRHRDPQSIRSDTSPTRKDQNARASLPQQRAEAAPTGPAPRRQKEQMGKSADGDARVLLRVHRLGDRLQRC